MVGVVPKVADQHPVRCTDWLHCLDRKRRRDRLPEEPSTRWPMVDDGLKCHTEPWLLRQLVDDDADWPPRDLPYRLDDG